jgi:ATP-binding cassette subfamily B (MDR/TAP) protein 8
MVAMQNTQKSLSHIGVLFGQSIKAFGSLGRVYEYITEAEDQAVNNKIILEEIEDKIEFKNVNFAYPTRPEAKVLNNFSLKIPVGKVLAICGTSGSGKSTIGQLIEKFYEIDDGDILVDGVSVKDIDSRSLRKNIGYINQEPILFHTTILENIRYGNPNATLEEVKEAARQANASHFIESFPKGYDTIVGDRGVALSGGQKQRIAIARAILKNPSILILDEATSALDSHSERIVQEALNRLMKGRTVIVIAHRLSTIKNADKIIVMKPYDILDGNRINIIESGNHRSLMRKKGEYYKFYKDLSRKDKNE